MRCSKSSIFFFFRHLMISIGHQMLCLLYISVIKWRRICFESETYPFLWCYSSSFDTRMNAHVVNTVENRTKHFTRNWIFIVESNERLCKMSMDNQKEEIKWHFFCAIKSRRQTNIENNLFNQFISRHEQQQWSYRVYVRKVIIHAKWILLIRETFIVTFSCRCFFPGAVDNYHQDNVLIMVCDFLIHSKKEKEKEEEETLYTTEQ